MLSCDTCISGRFGKVSFNQPSICSGDQRRASFSSTIARSLGLPASLQAFGRAARDHAARSARAARYRRRPPLALTSRLIVEGDLPKPAAIARNEASAARPREISSRSARLNRPGARRRGHAAITNALDAGVPLRDAQILARHTDPRTTEHYDRARGNLDRRGVHFLTAYVAGV
jgi:hypothetical protein